MVGNSSFGEKIRSFLGKSEIDERKAKYIDPDFVHEIGPACGIDFSHEKFTQMGDGYEACIYVYGYPKNVDRHWLNNLANISDTVCVFDLATLDQTQVKKNLNHSMEEQASRYNSAKNNAQALDAAQQLEEVESMYKEVSSYNQVMKALIARIYVPKRSLLDCDLRVEKICTDLEGSGYKCGVCYNETKQDFRNLFLSYDQQQGNLYSRKGQAMLSTTFAMGDPFHYTQLSDPLGVYYGTTDTGGSVLLDLFRKTARRLSYNSVVVGKMGSGKSTLLKKMIMDRVMRGDIIRVFDVTGDDFGELTEYLGGKIISLNGENGKIINVLQILPAGDTDSASYNMHVSKVTAIYRYLRPAADDNEILILKKLLRALYIQWGILSKEGRIIKDLDEMDVKDFPIFSDFLALVTEEINKGGELEIEENDPDIDLDEEGNVEGNINFAKIRKSQMKYVENIETALEDLCFSYGNIFNGHTSIDDFYSEQLVSFDISGLKGMEDSVFDAQLFNTLTMCWDNCVSVGRPMKYKWDHKEIAWEDICRFLIIVDEAHRIVSTDRIMAVNQILRFQREARKYFGGIVLASQSIRDFVPEGADSEAVNKLKNMFELCTYKWVMQQDANCRDQLARTFNGEFTEYELSSVSMLVMSEVILSIAGEQNLDFKVEVTDEELAVFAGGA